MTFVLQPEGRHRPDASDLGGLHGTSPGGAAEIKRWNCLDADGIVVGSLMAGSAAEAIQMLAEINRHNPERFRRRVCTLVSGGIRMVVGELALPQNSGT